MTRPHPTQAPRKTARAIDTLLTVVLILVQGGIGALTFVSLIVLPMSIDECGYQPCGDEQWITRAWWAGIISGVVGISFAIGGMVLLARRKVSFWMPLLGCIAQVSLIATAWFMASKAGPIT
ncbi:DUF6264 family protein [Mycobacterium kyorinense]|uniref:DUF6264 family protein n=1 Tax=Mycobacterium kyorinense TaxID=487514 RepID=UPI0005EDC754|nr:DUF6264 family protein [Mycobacterium kyorinense]